LSRGWLVGLAAIVCSTTVLHACMVLATNLPQSAFRRNVRPLLARYAGPQVSQNWALFAPNPPMENIHVLARARYGDRKTSGWYDVSQYFIISMRRNRLAPTRELAEGLAHAASTLLHSEGSARVPSEVVIRTSAMILRKYEPKATFEDIQVELDGWPILSGKWTKLSAQPLFVRQLDWTRFPDVASL